MAEQFSRLSSLKAVFGDAPLPLACSLAALLFVSGAFAHPGDGIVADAQGTIYFVARNPVHDTDHHACIYRMRRGENQPTPFYTSPHGSSNVHIVMGRDGYVYGAESRYYGERDGHDHYRARIWRFEESGEKTEALPEREGRSPYGGPAYLVDESGTVFYANGSAVRKHDRQGHDDVLFTIGTQSPETSLDTDVNDRIFNLAWGPDNSIYVLQLDRVSVWSEADGIRVLVDGLEHLPMDMAVDERGHAYLADWRARSVMHVSADGVLSTLVEGDEPWGAEGVAIHDESILVLEFTGPPATKIVPRLRSVTRSGDVTELYRFPE